MIWNKGNNRNNMHRATIKIVLHMLTRLQASGGIPPLPRAPAWCAKGL